MNLFEFFVKLTHPEKKNGWVETTAYFTGKVEKAAVGKTGRYHPADFNEYQIKYYAEDKERLGWYIFYPVPNPDPEQLEGTSIRIRYKKSKPWVFEAI